ncbi:MAG: hypothetical protein GY714_09490 [Desulfobacterales bacterium]|nr:hypothetical protein [Desulfobacterales bacterium]
MISKKRVVLTIILLLSFLSHAEAITTKDVVNYMRYIKPTYYFGLNFPLGVTQDNYQTGFVVGANFFDRRKLFGNIDPGLALSFHLLTPSGADDSYVDISFVPIARYYHPYAKFINPLMVNDPLEIFLQGGFGFTQWNSSGSSKLKVLDPSVSDTDLTLTLGTGLTSQRFELLILYTNVYAGTNIKYFTISVGIHF